ncbi:MAG: hypothetical protein ACOX6N_01665 [Patescibacteria group bacterium]|jgi:hypothetical protein
MLNLLNLKVWAAHDPSADGAGNTAMLPTYEGTGFTLEGKNLGQIITEFMPFVFTIAGVALLFVIIMGGVTLMTSGGDPNKTKEGYGKIVAGVIGFLIIFASYFIAQIIETILGMKLL